MSKKHKRNQQRMQAQALSLQPTAPRPALDPPVEQLEATAAAAGLGVSTAIDAVKEGGGAAIVHGEEPATICSRLQALIDAYSRGRADVENQERSLRARELELEAQR